jgi:amidase
MGQESIVPSVGPLGQSTRDLNLFMKSTLALKPWNVDPSIVPIPWQEVKVRKEDLTVAVMYDDGSAKPAPPITRALKETAAKLQKAGVKVVEWEPFDHFKGFDIAMRLYFADGAEEDFEILESTGEPLMPLTKWILKGELPIIMLTENRKSVCKATFRR